MSPTNPSTLNPNPSAAALPYNPALSLWLSVDPLSDKYPNLSPYVYCADNPVGMVDPDGRDIWELDECGKIVNHIEDNKIDQFHIVDSKGDCIAESEMYDAHTFQLKEQEGLTLFSSENRDAAKDIFFFMADNVDVEMDCYMLNIGCFVGTCQDEMGTNTIPTAAGLGTITEFSEHYHSHQGTSRSRGFPSQRDYSMTCKYPSTKFYIYLPTEGITIPYDQSTPYMGNGQLRNCKSIQSPTIITP